MTDHCCVLKFLLRLSVERKRIQSEISVSKFLQRSVDGPCCVLK